MKKIITTLCILAQSQITLAKDDVIQKWVDVKVTKGYILSLDLDKDKQCSKIWSKQIKAFMKMNPHIKNANKLFINQKIKVQDCKVEIKEVEQPKMEEIVKEVKSVELNQKQFEYFASIFIGANHLSEKNDTAKNGFSYGIRVGKNTEFKDKQLSFSVGILSNNSKTIDDNNDRGVYKINSLLFTGDAALFYKLNNKFSIGPKLMLAVSDDLSFSESKQNEHFAVYGGAEGLFKINKQYNLEFSIQQRIDTFSRTNVLGNIGLRFEF